MGHCFLLHEQHAGLNKTQTNNGDRQLFTMFTEVVIHQVRSRVIFSLTCMQSDNSDAHLKESKFKVLSHWLYFLEAEVASCFKLQSPLMVIMTRGTKVRLL